MRSMSCVVLPRPFWDGGRIAAFGVLAISILMVGLVAVTMLPPSLHPEPLVASATAAPAEPFDITLNASDLAPSDQGAVDILAAKLPPQALTSLVIHPANRPLPPVLQITVQGDASFFRLSQAAAQAQRAQQAIDRNDLKHALRFQHRAAELAPTNMTYRLKLAILYDRTANISGAIKLYRQILQAYAAHDPTLPPSLIIADIQRRAAYLSSMDSP